MRDPFYEQIRAALDGKRFDRELFEPCMCDVLRDEFPTLVPVSGGNDAGMDGAISDGRGEAFPLIATTDDEPIRNLKVNLSSASNSGKPIKRAVMATSVLLSPRRRSNLERAARAHGCTLVQIVDQAGVIDRLYRSPRWCKDLLGLSGDPPALSAVPDIRRPFFDLELIGREADARWIRDCEGDRVIKGQPGSGKTALVRTLVRDGRGLYLVSDDDGRIAASLRDQGPEVVIVDDAHKNPAILGMLRRMRYDLGFEFEIVATTWEGEADRVIDSLGVHSQQVWRLELLTRKEIHEVYQRIGVVAPARIMAELIDQAGNKPGLAVTLADLWKRGDWKEVLNGEALRRTLTATFERTVGPNSTAFLATLGLGGDRGMWLQVVADFLDLNLAEVRQLAIGLAAGGVLFDEGAGILSIWPRRLRWVLIRDFFFESPMRGLDFWSVIARAPDLESAALAVVNGALLSGDEGNGQRLRSLVSKCRKAEVWSAHTAFGERQARWAVENYPGDPVDLAPHVLVNAPRVMIPRLLELADHASGPLHSRLNHPLHELEHWTLELSMPLEGSMARRELVVEFARRHGRTGGRSSVGFHAFLLALSPKRRGTVRHPAEILQFQHRRELLPLEGLRRLSKLWRESHKDFAPLDDEMWSRARQLIREWVFPQYPVAPEDEPVQTRAFMRAFAQETLLDLSGMLGGSPGQEAALARLARRCSLDLPLTPDATFELLYPEDHGLDADQLGALRGLADSWLEKPIDEVAQHLALYEREARRIEYDHPGMIHYLAHLMAAKTAEPGAWLGCFMKHVPNEDLVEPFLEKVIEERPDRWVSLVKECLSLDPLRSRSARLVLQQEDMPEELLGQAIAAVSGLAELVETLCGAGKVPVPTLERLLTHDDWRSAVGAAIGEWLCDPEGGVRFEIESCWREAIVRYREEDSPGEHLSRHLDYWVGRILSSDTDLACIWLERCLVEDVLPIELHDTSAFVRTVDCLDRRQRSTVLSSLGGSSAALLVLPRLVARDPVVYEEVLAMDHLKRFHLRPLEGTPDSEWAELAMLAIEHGYEPGKIAAAAMDVLGAFLEIDAPDTWVQWREAFARLENHEAAAVREIAARGQELADARVERARESLKREEMLGVPP